MIPVPSYQVVQFLDWLHQREIRLSVENLNRDHLHGLAINFLSSAEIDQVGLEHPNLQFLLRVFQSCPMIHQNGVLAQMAHFAGCGQCMEFIRERERGHVVSELHPLLREFLAQSERSGFRERIDTALKQEFRHFGEGDRRFHSAIRHVGSDLEAQFRRFLEVCPTTLIRNYEIERGPARERDDDRWSRRRPREEDAPPISPDDSPEMAAYRLVNSVKELLTGSHYDERIVSDPQLCRFLSLATDFPENLAQSLEFLAWIFDQQPELDLAGDIPSEVVQDLVQSFCEARQYANAGSFGREVARWMSGEASETVLQRLRRFLRGHRRGSRSRSNGTPFRRYQSVRMHGMFLFLSTGDFPSFIDRHWRDLNALTGDSLDVYFSKEDLKNRVSGYETLSEFKSLRVPVIQLPAVVLWEKSLESAQSVPLCSLEHDEIMEVMKHLVHRIGEGDTIEEVVRSVTDTALSLARDKKLGSSEVINTKIIINGGDNIMNDKYEIAGQVGAVGANAHAHDMTFNQLWSDQSKKLELPILAEELARIRGSLRQDPASAEGDIAIGAVANAEIAAKEGNGPKALAYLKAAGMTALSCAKKIGTDVAVAAIKSAMGI